MIIFCFVLIINFMFLVTNKYIHFTSLENSFIYFSGTKDYLYVTGIIQYKTLFIILGIFNFFNLTIY